MSEFKVIKTRVEIFPHYNADSLELLKIDNYQCVVQKGLYKHLDVVVFAPEKSVLPTNLCEPFKNYLRGPHKNIVGSIRLRGELSMGVILPLNLVDPNNELPFDVDISEQLNIQKWEPAIPSHLSGVTIKLKDLAYKITHDCHQFSLYSNCFEEGERVLITEKLHGSQCILIQHKDNTIQISSKGLFKNNICLDEQPQNTYWQAARNSKIFELLQKYLPNKEVLVFGEVVPIQKGFLYGCTKLQPKIYVFKVVVEGKILGLKDINFLMPELQTVPLLSIEEFNEEKLIKLGKKLKQSSLDNHIAEGIVVSPVVPRYSIKGVELYLKIISDKYAKVEDFNAIS
jgi:RNA ligase (TIGR02306 family)